MITALAGPLQAQTPDFETRIFDVRYASLEELQKILSMFQVQMTSSASLRVISVRAPKNVMPLVEDAIKRLDVPLPAKKNAELTIYVLNATDREAGNAIPQVLQPVVTQLRNLFSYKNYRLIDTLIQRNADGEYLSASGMLPEAAFTRIAVPTQYSVQGSFKIQNGTDKSPVLQIDGFRFNVSVPIPSNSAPNKEGTPPAFTYAGIGIQTQVTIPVGQQIVVGKTTIGDSSLILVMSARFVD
jgi:hypothetical protein